MGARGVHMMGRSLSSQAGVSISTPKNSQCFLMTRKAPLTGDESTSSTLSAPVHVVMRSERSYIDVK